MEGCRNPLPWEIGHTVKTPQEFSSPVDFIAKAIHLKLAKFFQDLLRQLPEFLEVSYTRFCEFSSANSYLMHTAAKRIWDPL